MLELLTQTEGLDRALNSLEPGLKLIKKFEGKLNKAYLCPANKWTVGYGHVIIIDGRMADGITYKFQDLPIQYQVMSDSDIDWLLMKDAISYFCKMQKMINVKLNANQLGALLSFCFNVGLGNFQISSLRRCINQGGKYDPAMIEYYFLRFKRGGGRILNGLVKRRIAEANLFSRNREEESCVA